MSKQKESGATWWQKKEAEANKKHISNIPPKFFYLKKISKKVSRGGAQI